MLSKSGRFHIAKGLTAFAVFTAFAPREALADFFLHHWENIHETERNLRLSVEGGYYSSKDNYDGTGALLVPAGFQGYSRLHTDVTAAYGLIGKLTGYLRMSWALADLAHETNAGKSFGLTDQSAGLNFRAYESATGSKVPGLAIDLQLQGDFPAYSAPKSTAFAPGLGDGTLDITSGAFLTVPVMSNKQTYFELVGGGGYTYRTHSFSKAVPWSVLARYGHPDTGVLVSVAALGVQSLRNDPRAGTVPATSTTLSATSGGSFIGNAVNPSLLTFRGQLGYQFGPDLAVLTSVSKTLLGKSAPNSVDFSLGVKAHIGNHGKRDGAMLTPKDYGRSNQGFVNYSTEAHVTRANDRLNLVKIDKGLQDGVEEGQIFDIFRTKKDGSVGEAIARGHVTHVDSNEAAVTIDEYFKEIWIDEGFLAKRPVQ